VEEIRPARDPGAGDPSIPQGHDYGYDEAHDVPAGPLRGTPAPHRVNGPPEVNLGQGGYEGGDYQYDEAHDFGAR
jgi:hypothetical protein